MDGIGTLQNDILGFHSGSFGMRDAIIANEGYMEGATYAATSNGGSVGTIGLSMLSAAILGLMFFYVATRGRQF